MMMAQALVAAVYGILVLVGGWIGYRKAGSRPSLISGIASSVLLFVAAGMSATGSSRGGILAVVVSLVLLAFFSTRYSRGGKFMPAGLMALLSLAALAAFWILQP